MHQNSESPVQRKDDLKDFKNKPTNIEVASTIFEFVYQVRKFQLKQNRPDLDDQQLHQLTMEQIEQANSRQ